MKKRTIAILLSVVLTLLSCLFAPFSAAAQNTDGGESGAPADAPAPAEGAQPGDADGDGWMTSGDARAILRQAAKLEFLPDEFLTAADLDGDDYVKAKDARMALRRCALLDEEDAARFAPVHLPDFDAPVEGSDAFALNGPGAVTEGETFTLTAVLTDAAGFEDGVVFFRWDPEILEYVSQTNSEIGPAVGDRYAENACSAAAMFTNRLEDSSFTIATLTFRAVGVGSASIDYTFTSWNGTERPAGGSFMIQSQQDITVCYPYPGPETGEPEDPYSGTFYNASWRLDGSVLFFSGPSGTTDELSCIPDENESRGWNRYLSQIKTIVIDDQFHMVHSGQGALDYYTTFYENMPLLEAFSVDENNPYLCDIDGVLFSKDGGELFRFPENKGISTYAVPDSVTRISCGAFDDCKNLKTLTIPASVTDAARGAIDFEAMTVYCEADSAFATLARENGWKCVFIEKETPVVTTAAVPQGKTCLLGDADNDGKVKASDARKILLHSSRIQAETDAFLLKLMDVDGDGRIKAADARLALRIASRIDPVKPYEAPSGGEESASDPTGTTGTTQEPTGKIQPTAEDPSGTSEPDGVFKVTVGTAAAKKGDEVALAVNLSGNPGVRSLALEFTFDADALTLLGAEDSGRLEGLRFTSSDAEGVCSAVFEGDAPSGANGVIMTLKFRVNADSGFFPVSVTVKNASVIDENGGEANRLAGAIGGSVQVSSDPSMSVPEFSISMPTSPSITLAPIPTITLPSFSFHLG